MQEVLNQILEKPNSIARLITNSAIFKELYVKLREKTDHQINVSKKLRDLAWAPQRYASESKALGRIVLTWPAILALLQAIPQVRGNAAAEAQACLETLQWLNTEKIVQLSLMADAALELANLVRELDRSDLNEADVFEELERYRAVQRKLFVEGLVFQVPSCASVMARYLSKPTAILSGGLAKSIGGGDLTEDVRKRCLARMSAFVVLGEKVMEAEFPAFELLSCLRVFSLHDETRSKRQVEAGERDRCLEQLAQAIQVDADVLKFEFQHFQPIAKQFAQRDNLSNFGAWKKAILATGKTRSSHTIDALRPAIVRLGGWSSSSCEVERGFSKAKASKPDGCSQDEHVSLEETFLIIQDASSRGLSEKDWKTLFREASSVWASRCGRVRASGQKRCERWDKGIGRTGFCKNVARFLKAAPRTDI